MGTRKRETEKAEAMALQIIQDSHMFDGTDFVLKDKPDIQSVDKSWGIEVVRAIDNDIVQIEDAFRRKNMIPNSVKGIRVDGEIIEESTKCCDESGEILVETECSIKRMAMMAYGKNEFAVTIERIIQKLEKLQQGNYDGFSQKGLFVFTSVPECTKEWFVPILQGYENHMFDIIIFSDAPHYDSMGHLVKPSPWYITKEEVQLG